MFHFHALRHLHLSLLAMLIMALCVGLPADNAKAQTDTQTASLTGQELGGHLLGSWKGTSGGGWTDTYMGSPAGGKITSKGNNICHGTWSVTGTTVTYTYQGRKACRKNSTTCTVATTTASDTATFTCYDGEYVYDMKRQ